MNLLGRLLIVLILVGSIVFMSFAVVLYATHTNWKKRADDLQSQLTAKNDEFNKLQSAKSSMESALKLEGTRQADRVSSLSEKVRQLTGDNEQANNELAQLKEQLATQTAAVQASHETAEKLRGRLDGASKAQFDAQNQWVDMSTQLTKKIDEVHSLALQVTTYQSVCAGLAKDYADAVEVLRKHGLSADPALYTSRPPDGIRGVVTEVRPKGIVEVSVGSDSGLVKGHQLDVIRNLEGRSSYVGKIEITDTSPDRAVARVMPEFRRGVVQRDDEITYIDVSELTAH